MITSPSMCKVLCQQESSVSPEPIADRVMETVFGSQKAMRKTIRKSQIQSTECLVQGPYLSRTPPALLRDVEHATPNLLSFMPSIVDQSVWERMGRVSVIAGSKPP